MSNIDWSRPLEAYHPDGSVVDCQPISPDDPSTWPDHQGQYHIDGEGVPLFFEKDGTEWVEARPHEGWRIRNKAEPKADIPEWAIKRARDIGRAEMPDSHIVNVGEVVRNFARYIMTKEEPPVDPIILKARELAKPWLIYRNTSIDAGDHDDTPAIQALLEAIKFGRELERGEVK